MHVLFHLISCWARSTATVHSITLLENVEMRARWVWWQYHLDKPPCEWTFIKNYNDPSFSMRWKQKNNKIKTHETQTIAIISTVQEIIIDFICVAWGELHCGRRKTSTNAAKPHTNSKHHVRKWKKLKWFRQMHMHSKEHSQSTFISHIKMLITF